tara:strand:- start:185 stop:1015 length:831 start_codon:yes stop_codon:yes gene_type:complete
MILNAKSKEFMIWAAEKEANVPSSINDLTLVIEDINHIKSDEISKIKSLMKRYNCCLYKSKTKLKSKEDLINFTQCLGMKTYDVNNIDNNAVCSITRNKVNDGKGYIPYTDKALNWHTDGYYDEKPIYSWLLHCVVPAIEGGESHLLDHEIVIRQYVLKHDDIELLERKNAFTIPGNIDAGRLDTTSYICSDDNRYKKLHMKFSMRKENISLNDDVKSAIIKMKKIIEDDCKKYYLTYKLSKNEGIISNNILHGRNSYKDDDNMREIFRIRSYERI